MNPLEKIPEIIAKLDEKNRYYILGGILLGIFLLDYFLVMQPQLATLRSLNPKISLLAKDIRSAEDSIHQYTKYQKDLTNLKEKGTVVNERIISKEEVPMVMEKISRMANKSGVKIDQIMPLKGSEAVLMKNNDGKYSALPIQVEARSGYHDFGRFINQLENSEIFLSVANFSFAADASDTLRQAARLTVKIVVFDKTDKAQPGAQK